MAHEHTTPQRSLQAAYAAEQRAQAGIESRLRKDTCYGLYEASLKCLDQNDYNRDACEEAFDAFKACRANQKASKAGGEGTSAFASMIKAQEKDPLVGPVITFISEWSSSKQDQQPKESEQQQSSEPEPEWKLAKRLREEQQQLEAEMRRVEAVLQEQRQQQEEQQRGSSRRRWFWFGGGGGGGKKE